MCEKDKILDPSNKTSFDPIVGEIPDTIKENVEKIFENTIIKWSNGMGSRSRKSHLIFIKGDEIIPFHGTNIPGVCVVRGSDYEQNGKWSATTYRIELGKGVKSMPFKNGWETNTFLEGIGRANLKGTPDTWTELSELLNISVPSLKRFLSDFRPKVVKILDKVDEDLEELEDSVEFDTDCDKVSVNFGAPTNRSIREGFWEKPKGIPGYKAEIRLINPTCGWVKGNIMVAGSIGKILGVSYSNGRNGGYYAISVGIIPNTECAIPAFETQLEKEASDSKMPKELFVAFDGDEQLIQQFMNNVSELDFCRIDRHEIHCGRGRIKSEVERVSGNSDFFLGIDPLKVHSYILQIMRKDIDNYQYKAIEEPSIGNMDNSPFAVLKGLLDK